MDSVENIPIRFERILLSSDFTDVSAKALPYAAAIARRFGPGFTWRTSLRQKTMPISNLENVMPRWPK